MRAGDVLVRPPGSRSPWRLARSGIELAADQVPLLCARSFGGGGVRPSGDHLPGFAAGLSQTWSWQPASTGLSTGTGDKSSPRAGRPRLSTAT